MIELTSPKSVLGRNTETAMQAGIVYGFAGLVENIIKKIKFELGEEKVTVVATGGMSKIIKEEVSSIDFVDRTLTLNGLRLIYDLNQKGERK